MNGSPAYTAAKHGVIGLTRAAALDYTAQYSAHAQVQSKPGRRKISDIKLMKEDPAGVEAAADEIKTRYAKLFRV